MSYISNCRIFIEKNKARYLNLIEEWAAINSHSYNTFGLQKCLHAISQAFTFPNKKEHSLSHHKIVADDGSTTELPLGQALEIFSQNNAKDFVLLAGHYDTVYKPTSPFQHTSRHGDRLSGPGVADMKGGLAVLLASLEAFESCYTGKKIEWKVLITPDEEIGSPGSKSLYKKQSKDCLAALIFEPAFSTGAWVDQRSGSYNVTIDVRGKAAHAGRDFEKGKSALLAFSPLLSALRELPRICTEMTGSKVTINVGKLTAGSAYNIVPDFCIARINIRSTSLNALQFTQKTLRDLIDIFDLDADIRMNLIEDGFHPPKTLDEKTKKLFDLLKSSAQELQIPFKTDVSYGATDGSDLASYGIPTLDSLGVVGGDLHTENEYMHIDRFTERALVSALLLSKLSDGKSA